MKGTGAVVLAAIVLVVSVALGRAQVLEPVKPQLSSVRSLMSSVRALKAKKRSDALQQFISTVKQQPAGQPVRSPAPVIPPITGGTWDTIAFPNYALGNPLLLTDGTVIIHVGQSQTWYRLSPDINGSYVNGSVSTIAPLPSGYGPLYFASAVLPDGRVIAEGGEYNISCNTNIWTSLGAIYDPVTDTWTSVSPPSGTGWINTDACGTAQENGGIGDAPSIVLPNGMFMLGSCCAWPPSDALLNASNLTWSSTGGPNYAQAEQSYTLLPDGRVLTIDIWAPCSPNCVVNTAEAYSPSSGTWSYIANPPISLPDPCGSYEIGPAVLRPDGTVVAFGGNTGCPATNGAPDPTAIYNSANNTWIQGPNVPAIAGVNYTLADAPAALLPNGNILFAASPGLFQTDTHFFEFTGDNTINQVADAVYYASVASSYNYNFLVLPTGQILATDYSGIVEIYTPTGSPDPSWAPAITSVSSTLALGQSYSLSGTQLNGLSQGAAFGDDVQSATNYPLVRVTNNATGHVFYARTFNHSTMSVAPNTASSTNFVLPSNMEVGPSQLVVVANGIPSQPVAVTVEYPPLTLLITPSSNIVASGSYGGPFTPSSFQYQLSTSSGTVNYSISGIPNWLTASSTTGTATTSPTTVTFTTNSTANSLSPGTYNATITFTNTTTSKIALVIAAKLTVSPQATTTALVSAPNPSTIGQSVTFTATVSASVGTPTGTVTFTDGVTTLGTGVLTSGVANFSTSSLALGTHNITAVYSGDTNFAASTSSSLSQSVIQYATTTALNSSVKIGRAHV
jgi:hypothetical protein